MAGTRSRIAIQTDQGIQSIYCHWDGYPEHVGRLLVEHYTSSEKRTALMALGDLSQLDAEIGVKQDFDRPIAGTCVAYGRDSDVDNTTAQFAGNVAQLIAQAYNCGAEHVYLFDNDEWRFVHCGEYRAFEQFDSNSSAGWTAMQSVKAALVKSAEQDS